MGYDEHDESRRHQPSKGEYGGQTADRMSVRPLQKQSTASAAPTRPGHHVAGGRLSTTVHGERSIAGTARGGPASVRAGSTKTGSSAPRRVKVKRHRSNQGPDGKGQLGMKGVGSYKGAR